MTLALVSWDADPLSAFHTLVISPEWVATSPRSASRKRERPLSSRSANTYIAMFGKFARFLADQRIQFSTASPEHIQAFLAANRHAIDSEIAVRYLRMLERCYLVLGIHPNPAARAYFLQDTKPLLKMDLDMVSLSRPQFHALLANLPAPTTWKRRRNRAMLVVMACAGTTLAQTIALKPDDFSPQTETDGTLMIAIRPTINENYTPTHSTRLMAIGVPELIDYLMLRKTIPVPGDLLFPGTHGEPLNPSTIYRLVAQVLANCAIKTTHDGPRILRNTWAALQLDSGVSPVELGDMLGLVERRSVEPYAGLVL